jgi:hypothetical protein
MPVWLWTPGEIVGEDLMPARQVSGGHGSRDGAAGSAATVDAPWGDARSSPVRGERGEPKSIRFGGASDQTAPRVLP